MKRKPEEIDLTADTPPKQKEKKNDPQHPISTSSIILIQQSEMNALLSSDNDLIAAKNIIRSDFAWPRDRSVHCVLSSMFGSKFFSASSTPLWSAEAERYLGGSGLSSVKNWGLPFHCLSNGQQARCSITRILILYAHSVAHEGSNDLFLLENFDSVLDADTERSMTIALGKALVKIRNSSTSLEQAPSIIVGCASLHSETNHLNADFVLQQTNSGFEKVDRFPVPELKVVYRFPVPEFSLDNGSKQNNIENCSNFAPTRKSSS